MVRKTIWQTACDVSHVAFIKNKAKSCLRAKKHSLKISQVQRIMENKGEIIIYQTPDKRVQLDVQLEGDTLWLTQAQMSKLFDRERSVVAKHIRNLFVEGELKEKSNVQNLHIAKILLTIRIVFPYNKGNDFKKKLS